jgi:hypothetical protein
MTRPLFPGQHKFHIVSKEAMQAKRRADTRRRMAKLRERRLNEAQDKNVIAGRIQEQAREAKRRATAQIQMADLRARRLKEHNNEFMAEEIMAEQAIKRSALDLYPEF